MFRSYALDLKEIYPLIKDQSAESLYEPFDAEGVSDTLNNMLNAKAPFLNAKALCDLFFPPVECPVFLSHSGKDKDNVRRFARWLNEKFEINAFIDSDLWGCIDVLQKKLDCSCRIDPVTRKHLVNPGNSHRATYDYNERNYSTAHVHMMLSHALTQMIHSSECFIFLRTSKSISHHDAITGTFSSWIFHELATVDTIKVNRSRDSLPSDESLAQENFSALMECVGSRQEIFYPVPLNRPYRLKKGELERWASQDFDFDNDIGSFDDPLSWFWDGFDYNDPLPTKKWERALNWLYINCSSKGGDD